MSSPYSITSKIPILHLYPDPLQTGQTFPDESLPAHTLSLPSRKFFHCAWSIPLFFNSLVNTDLSILLSVSFAYAYCLSFEKSTNAEQLEQTFLTKRCAITKLNVPASIYGFAHKFKTLVIVSAEEFVWIVENTKCQVMAASIAISNVSLSRISQTMMISGS